MLSLTPAEGPSTFEAVLLDVPEKTTSLSGEYIELGDLDYQTLLQNEAIAVDLKAPATGELLAQQGASELSEAVRLRLRSLVSLWISVTTNKSLQAARKITMVLGSLNFINREPRNCKIEFEY
jgi:hypothetical protein